MANDAAGMPFAGRALPDPGFAGDSGEADGQLVAALAAHAHDPGAEQEVLAALTSARVLAAVMAVAAEVTVGAREGGPGLAVEKSTDMAVATLLGSDGRRALPVFTSIATLARWRADARPVPLTGSRAALAAAAEGADALAIDIAGPASYVVAGSAALEALARGQLHVPAYADERFAAEVAHAAAIPGVAGTELTRAAGLDAMVELRLEPDADASAVAGAVAQRLRSLSSRPLLRGLGLAVVGPPPRVR